ncbi:MAG: peptide-methionine (R)-S-oxide reductase MsrB [Candidatus Altiarchaeota archaeon]
MANNRKTDEEWRSILNRSEYHILREKGTEQSFSGEHVDEKRPGVFVCAGCGNILFKSEAKFDSGSGWPSFWEVVSKDSVELREDLSYNTRRIEVLCRKCGGHLGHMFEDGPKPTGKRYCVNSTALKFNEYKENKPKKE